MHVNVSRHLESGHRLGVIDCLSAGFRYLGWRLELIVIPVALDLLLWLAPQFTIVPMTSEVAGWYRTLGAADGLPVDAVTMTQQVAESIEMLGESFNLLSAMVSTTLLHVPSLLAGGALSSPLAPIPVSTPGEAIVFWLVFSLLGLLIGVIYLGMLARRLPIGGMSGMPMRTFAGAVIRQWLQVIAFVLIVFLALVAIYIPLSIGIALFSVLSPALASFLAVASGAVTLVIFFYLYFATAGIVMDNLSAPATISRSVNLVRMNFLPTLGFFAVSTLIGLGMTVLLLQLSNLALWVVTPAIVISAYIGTGLAMALLVFYRTRYLGTESTLVA